MSDNPYSKYVAPTADNPYSKFAGGSSSTASTSNPETSSGSSAAKPDNELTTGAKEAGMALPVGLSGWGGAAAASAAAAPLTEAATAINPLLGVATEAGVALVGGFGGSVAGQKLVNEAIHLPGVQPLLSLIGLDDNQRAANEKANPYSAFTGQLAGQIVGGGMRPGIPSVKQAALGSAVNLGIEGGNQVAEGKYDPTKLAIAAGAGALTKPMLGKDVHPEVAKPATESSAKPEVPAENVDPSFIDTTKKAGETLRSAKNISLLRDIDNMENFKKAQKEGYKGDVPAQVQEHLVEPDKLSSTNRGFVEKYIDPLVKDNKNSYAEIQGIDPTDPHLEDYHARIAVKGYWKRFFGGLADESSGGGFSFGNKPGVLKRRSVFQVTDPTTGHTQIITQTKDGSILGWNNKTPSMFSSHEKSLKAGMEVNGHKVEQVLDQNLIQKHTDLKYVADPLFVASVKSSELGRYADQLRVLEKIKQSPIWKEMTSSVEDDNPNHVKLKYGERIPSLRNTRFDPELAYEFDDFLRPGSDSSFVRTLHGLNSTAIKMWMLLPFKHMNNEVTHYLVADGLTGMIPDAAKRNGIAQASNDILHRSQFFRDVMHTPGASLLSPRTIYDGWSEGMLEHLMTNAKKDPTVVSKIQEMGLTPVKFFNAWSKLSGKSMWMVRDITYMGLVRERYTKLMQQGSSHEKAIYDSVHHVNQYMPTYQLPTKVLSSRFLSELMQNPVLNSFSPYHHGALSAIGTSLKNLATSGKRLEGIDHIAAYSFMLAAVYPLLDSLYQAYTGDKNARARRAGGLHYIAAGTDVAISAMQGKRPEKGIQQLTGSVITPAPVPYSIFQNVINRDIYTGQPVRYAGDSVVGQTYDSAKYAQQGMANPMGITPVLQGKQPFNEWILGQLMDAEFPKPSKQKKAGEFENRALKTHVRKRGWK